MDILVAIIFTAHLDTLLCNIVGATSTLLTGNPPFWRVLEIDRWHVFRLINDINEVLGRPLTQEVRTVGDLPLPLSTHFFHFLNNDLAYDLCNLQMNII